MSLDTVSAATRRRSARRASRRRRASLVAARRALVLARMWMLLTGAEPMLVAEIQDVERRVTQALGRLA
jgi:hypothetical protein